MYLKIFYISPAQPVDFMSLKQTIKELLISQELCVRETGLEERKKRPYRALSSLFVKN